MGSSSGASGRGESKSPKQFSNPSPPQTDAQPESKNDAPLKPDSSSNAEATKPLAPPPRPGQQLGANTPDYFSNPLGGSLSLEPNPFEQSFGGAPPETPGATKLPSVAALTSPSSLLPGPGATPFPWGPSSLRTGPLSPAMLSGPTTNDYFGDTHHIRGGFPTPNESSLRTGLTPGGSGSMFPAPSPNSQALFAQLTASAPTPSTLDFHRTALSAAAAKREQAQAQAQAQQPANTQPQENGNGVALLKLETKPPAGPFDPHDNDAANGLFMLAQGRNGSQQQSQQFAVIPPVQIHAQPAAQPAPAVQPVNTSPQMNGNGSVAGSSARGVSEALSAGSDESETAVRPPPRTKGKRNSGGAGTRRKADDTPAKAPASKKAKTNGGGAPSIDSMDMGDSDDDMKINENGTRTKMTDEEKRKNFLERNRVAALKCRQRKKQWLANLQTKVEIFSSENDALTQQISQLRDEVVNLKTLLLAHKDCPVTQQQGLHGAYMQQSMEPFNPQMNSYGLGGPVQSQPVIAGQGVNRRFS
ncbi:Aft1 HRA domain-containing protein [Lasiosphaeria miniovina]|uniref:Aft1 HRA domain-containing protein n=1 Tax=Lasiosphaeria miniovina TaxID=1954250 RepID=A0AA40B6I5_9PEZI|nr:Aft1 HRA domain-containing protein [Lasiosphaeria miniovina]KAK0728578.1 Aft1 HRA domain-containing protein [Lasiosphaeria miniovina]